MSGGTGYVRLQLSSSGSYLAEWNDGGSKQSSKSGVQISRWQHVVAVFASNTSRTVYLDGVAGAENTTSVADVSVNRTTVSGIYFNTSVVQKFRGRIAHANIWDAALSDADVAILADGKPPNEMHPESLAAYWPLDGNDWDQFGKYNLRAYNTPGWANGPPKMQRRSRKSFLGPLLSVGGAAFQPAWARGHNQLIGGGLAA